MSDKHKNDMGLWGCQQLCAVEKLHNNEASMGYEGKNMQEKLAQKGKGEKIGSKEEQFVFWHLAFSKASSN